MITDDMLVVDTEEEIRALWDDEKGLSALMQRIAEDMRWIDSQLADSNRTGTEGERLSNHDYCSWRGRAVAAKTHKTQLYVRLKARRTELRNISWESIRAERKARIAAEQQREQATTDDPLLTAYQSAVVTVRYLRQLLNDRDEDVPEPEQT